MATWSAFTLTGFYESFDSAQRIPVLDPNIVFPDLVLSDLSGDDWAMLLEYRFANNIARLAYAGADFNLPDEARNASDRIDQYVLGIQHNFNKRTRVWVEYTYVEADTDEEDAVTLGLRHDF